MSKDKTRPSQPEAVRRTSIGGQALMEGIMMRGPVKTAMAVRNPQGEIVIEEMPTPGAKRSKILRFPIIRGVVSYIDSMVFGYKCLMRSAEISGLEEAEEELAREKEERKRARAEKKAAAGKDTVESPETDAGTSPSEPARDGSVAGVSDATETPGAESVPDVAETQDAKETADTAETADTTDASDGSETTGQRIADDKSQPTDKKSGSGAMTTAVMIFSVLFALVIAVGLFIWLPAFLYKILANNVSWLDPDDRYVKSVFCGILKIIILVGYMACMSLIKDIRRTFQFHGAEHKTIFCYEAGLELTVENVRKMKRFHPRCGTSFLILMVLVSVIVGFLIPAWDNLTWLYTLTKIALIPIIVGFGYELIRFCGRHDNWLTKVIAAPGLWLQRITVFEPDDSMIECAIEAVKRVIPNDGSDKW